MGFKYLPHTADVRARVTARDLEGVFASAAALFRDLVVGSSPVEVREERTFELAGTDEQRCFDFLRELLFVYDTERFLPAAVRLRGSEVEIKGEIFDPERHAAEGDLKAVTHHGFELRHEDGAWILEVVFDI